MIQPWRSVTGTGDRARALFSQYGGPNGPGRPAAIFKIGDAWFYTHWCGKDQLSIIDALDTGRSGGETVVGIASMLQTFGLTLLDCLQDNPDRTLESLQKKCGEAIKEVEPFGYENRRVEQILSAIYDLMGSVSRDSIYPRAWWILSDTADKIKQLCPRMKQ